MGEWWKTVMTMVEAEVEARGSGAYVAEAVFQYTTPRGDPLWHIIYGPGFIENGQVFYTGKITRCAALGDCCRDYVFNSVVSDLRGTPG